MHITFPTGLKLYFSQKMFCSISLFPSSSITTRKANFLISSFSTFRKHRSLLRPLSDKFKKASRFALSEALRNLHHDNSRHIIINALTSRIYSALCITDHHWCSWRTHRITLWYYAQCYSSLNYILLFALKLTMESIFNINGFELRLHLQGADNWKFSSGKDIHYSQNHWR